MKVFSVFLLFGFLVHSAAQTPAYTVTDIGTLGGQVSTAAAVNNAGQVVGSSDLEDEKHVHAFFFDGNRILDIGTLGGTESDAVSINDKGQVVGNASITNDEFTHAFLWQKSTMTDLQVLNKESSEAKGINISGEIIGFSYVPFKIKNGVVTGNFTMPRRAFLRVENAIAYLLDPSATGPDALGINDAGAVVGSMQTPGDGHIFLMPDTATQGRFSRSAISTDYDTRACVWQEKKITLLKSLGGKSSEARTISNSGQIAGKAALRRDKAVHACLWQNGTVAAQDLGTLGGVNSQANSINGKGQIVGWSDAADRKSEHAFLYDQEKMTDLNILIDHKYGWVLLEATGISDTGFICGTGVVDGQQHAFLLTPVLSASGK